MEVFTTEEFEKVKHNYHNLTKYKEDSHGSVYYEATTVCDRCRGEKVIYAGRINGKLVTVQPDNGVCWKCMGSGIMTVKIKVMKVEYAAKLQAKKKETVEKKLEENKQKIYNKNIELGYKLINFTVEEWVGLPIEKYKYYRFACETKKAVLINLLKDLYDEDKDAIGRWVPIKTVHFKEV